MTTRRMGTSILSASKTAKVLGAACLLLSIAGAFAACSGPTESDASNADALGSSARRAKLPYSACGPRVGCVNALK
jgi:hypothetical protein